MLGKTFKFKFNFQLSMAQKDFRSNRLFIRTIALFSIFTHILCQPGGVTFSPAEVARNTSANFTFISSKIKIPSDSSTNPSYPNIAIIIPQGFLPATGNYCTTTLNISECSYDGISQITIYPIADQSNFFNITLTLNTTINVTTFATFKLLITSSSGTVSYSGSFNVIVSYCGQRQFLNYSSNQCQYCDSNCSSCIQTANSCTSCTSPFILTKGICKQSINVHTCGQDSIKSLGYCLACSLMCKQCNSSKENCISCHSDRYLINNTCEYCDQTCRTCSQNSTNCLACSAGLEPAYSLPGICITPCPNNTFFDGSSCSPCDPLCLTCSLSSNNCTSCHPQYNLFNNSCKNTPLNCTSKQFLSTNTSQCIDCPIHCLTCLSLSSCTSCENTFFLYNGACISPCPSGFFVKSSFVCEICSSQCLTCSNISSNCTSCNKTSTLRYLFQSTCLSSCPLGFTPSSDNTTCIANVSVQSSVSQSSFLPLPAMIAFTIPLFLAFSKNYYPKTLIPSFLCAFSGVLENMSWIILFGLYFLRSNLQKQSPSPLSFISLGIISIAWLINLVLNSINLYLFITNIFSDDKFHKNYQRLRTKIKKSIFYSVVILSIIFSHKFIELLFSNLFSAFALRFKVNSVLKIKAQNYVRYVSIVVSLLAIGSAALMFVTQQSIHGYLYWQSIDVIAISLTSAILTLVVTKRKAQDYQNSIDKSFSFQKHNPKDHPEPVIQFMELKKDFSSDFSGAYNIGQSINITDENLFAKNEERTEEAYYNEIHIAARQKEDRELKQTRLTYNPNSKRKNNNQSMQNSISSNQIEDQAPPTLKRPQRRSRSRNKRFMEQQEKPIKQIEKNWTPAQIQWMKIIRRADQVAFLVNQTIKDELKTSEHRLNPHAKLNETFDFIMGLNDNQVGVLQKKTRTLLQDIQQALLQLQAAKITPDEFLQYLQRLEGQGQGQEKQNMRYDNSPFPMPPLPKQPRGRRRSSKEKGSNSNNNSNSNNSHKQKSMIHQKNHKDQSPMVNQFVPNPTSPWKGEYKLNSFEEIYHEVNNVRQHPRAPLRQITKTPKSQEIDEEMNGTEERAEVRPYIPLSNVITQIPRRYSSIERSHSKELSQQQKVQRDEVHIEDGLGSMKKAEKDRQQQLLSTPPSNPFISLSRLQQAHKVESIVFTDQLGHQQQLNSEFQVGESVANVMGRYCNKDRQEGNEEIPDEDDEQLRRMRRKRQQNQRNRQGLYTKENK